MQESLNNVMIVKTFQKEDYTFNNIDKLQKSILDLSMKKTKISILSKLCSKLCSSVAYFTIFCLGAINLSKGIGSYGSLAAMIQLYNNIQGPFSSLAGTFPQFIGCIAAIERLMELKDLNLEEYKEEKTKFNNPSLKFKDISFNMSLILTSSHK